MPDQYIKAPDGSYVKFPDGMSDADIGTAMGKLYPSKPEGLPPATISAGAPSLYDKAKAWLTRAPAYGGTLSSQGEAPISKLEDLGKGVGVGALASGLIWAGSNPIVRGIGGGYAAKKLNNWLGNPVPDWVAETGGAAIAGGVPIRKAVGSILAGGLRTVTEDAAPTIAKEAMPAAEQAVQYVTDPGMNLPGGEAFSVPRTEIGDMLKNGDPAVRARALDVAKRLGQTTLVLPKGLS